MNSWMDGSIDRWMDGQTSGSHLNFILQLCAELMTTLNTSTRKAKMNRVCCHNNAFFKIILFFCSLI